MFTAVLTSLPDALGLFIAGSVLILARVLLRRVVVNSEIRFGLHPSRTRKDGLLT
jgi:hypothetical protein